MMANWRMFTTYNPEDRYVDGEPTIVNMDLVFEIEDDHQVEGVVRLWTYGGRCVRVKATLHDFIDHFRPTQIGGTK